MTEERSMEIEALTAIYMESFNFGIILDIKFTPDYPNEVPIIELLPQLTLEKDRILDLEKDIIQLANENIGTSMIFILAGTIKDWLDNNNFEPKEEEEEEEPEETISVNIVEEEEENHAFEGTPVTLESFMEWRKKFIAETQPQKKEQKQTKLTGRQLFEYDSSLIISDSKLMEEGEETSNISASSIKGKVEDVAAQVDWTLFEDDDIPDDIDDDEDD
eukprot:gene7674-9442_t